MTGRITLAGERHAIEERATNDNPAKIVALNGYIPILKPIARAMFQADQSTPVENGATVSRLAVSSPTRTLAPKGIGQVRHALR